MLPRTPIDFDRIDRKVSRRTLVMGVINVTPDSFSDGGDHFAVEAAVSAARLMAVDGADILDIGGESTRPGATPIDAAAELERVMPVIEALAASDGPPLSIDTYKSEVARAALGAGARMVNDVTGLGRDPAIAAVVAEHDAALVIGHWEPDVTLGAGTVLDAVRRFLDAAAAKARAAGVADRRIVLDPGIGFGKDEAANLVLLAALDAITALGYPVLVGASRKRFIGTLTGRVPRERLAGSLAAHVLAAMAGASIVRAHDVAAHREALAVADAVIDVGAREGGKP